MRTNTKLIPVIAVLGGLLLGSAAAPATSGALVVGMGDQKPFVYGTPLYKQTGMKRARLFIGWDSIRKEKRTIDAWMASVRANGQEPFVAFRQSRGSRCPRRPCVLPSVKSFTRAFKAFRRAYPFVKNYQPWNEVNNNTEPTGKKPERAAEYYLAMRKNCRGCKVHGADLLDIKNMSSYLKKFLKKVAEEGGKPPKFWGLHNYGDVNRFRTKFTKALLARTKKGTKISRGRGRRPMRLPNSEIWFTETGPITSFRASDGRLIFPESESRAVRAIGQMFRLAKLNRKRIKRIYMYYFQYDGVDRFNTALVNPDGSPRPAYDTLLRNRFAK